MRLRSKIGHAFELTILGYQYPDATTGFDANWLLVEILVEHPRNCWSSVDPSLLTDELERLADWFSSFGDEKPARPTCRFTEPNLAFELEPPDAPECLRIYFDLESRPPWSESAAADADAELWVEFGLSEFECQDVASALREQLARYPKRSTPDEASS